MLAYVSSWYVPIHLQIFLYILTNKDAPGSFCTFLSQLGISHFSKEFWLLLVEKVLRKQDLSPKCDHCCSNDAAFRSFLRTELGSICIYPRYAYAHIYILCTAVCICLYTKNHGIISISAIPVQHYRFFCVFFSHFIYWTLFFNSENLDSIFLNAFIYLIIRVVCKTQGLPCETAPSPTFANTICSPCLGTHILHGPCHYHGYPLHPAQALKHLSATIAPLTM